MSFFEKLSYSLKHFIGGDIVNCPGKTNTASVRLYSVKGCDGAIVDGFTDTSSLKRAIVDEVNKTGYLPALNAEPEHITADRIEIYDYGYKMVHPWLVHNNPKYKDIPDDKRIHYGVEAWISYPDESLIAKTKMWAQLAFF